MSHRYRSNIIFPVFRYMYQCRTRTEKLKTKRNMSTRVLGTCSLLRYVALDRKKFNSYKCGARKLRGETLLTKRESKIVFPVWRLTRQLRQRSLRLTDWGATRSVKVKIIWQVIRFESPVSVELESRSRHKSRHCSRGGINWNCVAMFMWDFERLLGRERRELRGNLEPNIKKQGSLELCGRNNNNKRTHNTVKLSCSPKKCCRRRKLIIYSLKFV